MSQPILELKNLDVFYGPIQALKKVSLHINEGKPSALSAPTAPASRPC